MAGGIFRRFRDRKDARLHAGRYEALKKRLHGMRRPRSILVICHGNICRSPYLEALLKRSLPDVQVSSAGFVGAGRGVPEHSTTVAGKAGLDLSTHRSRLLTRDILASADLLIVMDGRQLQALTRGFGVPAERVVVAGDLDPLPGATRAIKDPWGKDLPAFESSFVRLERCAESLAFLLRGAL
jgi:protein-tyrosine phosphatase